MKLKKCLLLLPTTFNDGTQVPQETLSSIIRRIDDAFGDHTVDGYCDGVYRMDDGSKARDRSLKVWIVMDPGRVDELKAYAQDFASELKQETLWFEVTEAEVDFVRPTPKPGEV